jgi:hypothetical protein
MPKLLVFAPCERVILAAEGDPSASLIAILQGFGVPVRPPRDERVNIPMVWHIFSLWEQVSDDDLSYRQKFQLVGASGEELIMSRVLPVIAKTDRPKRFHRVNVRIAGFPLKGDAGDYLVKLWVSSDAGDSFTEHASFPIPVSIGSVDPVQQS